MRFSTRLAGVLGVVLCCRIASGRGKAESQAAEPIEFPAGQRQLFLDDYCVAQIDGLAKNMHPPVKKGAVVVPDQPWEKWVQTRCAPAWSEDEEVFKLWLTVCPPAVKHASTAYVESRDAIHWTKPILRQQEYQGSTANNFLVVDPNLPGGANCIEGVVYDASDPDPKRRYKGLLGAEDRTPIVSPNGIHWKQLGAVPLAGSDEGNLSYDRDTSTFIATLKTFSKHGRAQAIWTSKDFVKWNRLPAIFEADDEDQQLAKHVIEARLANPMLQQPVCNHPPDYHADIYNLGLFRYEGLYVGMPAFYYATGKDAAGINTDGFHLIQLACSRDLVKWQRLGDRQPFLSPSPVGQGAYDLTQLLPAGAPLVRQDELWFYYTGLKYREPPPDADLKQGAVCLAVLRRDGFVSLDAAGTPGSLVTKQLVVCGTKLLVNAEAVYGNVMIEVLGGQNQRLAISEPVVGDELRGIVRWRSGQLTELKGAIVRLRFTLKNASLYSFWLDN